MKDDRADNTSTATGCDVGSTSYTTLNKQKMKQKSFLLLTRQVLVTSYIVRKRNALPCLLKEWNAALH